MATYFAGLKVQTAVAIGNGGSYTVPANSYFLGQFATQTIGPTFTIRLFGTDYAPNEAITEIVMGPGQSTLLSGGGVSLTGVEFKNAS